ncbi:MAG: ABC transporter permease [Nevskiales bacterium]
MSFNAYGCWTLLRKEVLRFWRVSGQTVLAPMLTAVLYLLVFRQVMAAHVEVYDGVSYAAFLIPGLMMMSVIQNAFANTSSSLIQSKINGNLVFLLMTPLSALEIFLAFVGAALLRGVVVASGVYLVARLFMPLPLEAPLVAFGMLVLVSVALGVLGLIAAVFAEKFEHLAAFQNFLIMPFSFLSGVFYSIRDLPQLWNTLSLYNPFFYMIDGFRYGFFGVSDAAPAQSLAVVGAFALLTSALGLWLLRSGYKLRP